MRPTTASLSTRSKASVCRDCGGDCDSLLAAIEARPVVSTRSVGSRTIRAGELVRISGLVRGCVPTSGPKGPVLASGFRVLGFRGREVIVFGRKGPRRVDHVRTFDIERIAPVDGRPRGSNSRAAMRQPTTGAESRTR